LVSHLPPIFHPTVLKKNNIYSAKHKSCYDENFLYINAVTVSQNTNDENPGTRNIIFIMIYAPRCKLFSKHKFAPDTATFLPADLPREEGCVN